MVPGMQDGFSRKRFRLLISQRSWLAKIESTRVSALQEFSLQAQRIACLGGIPRGACQGLATVLPHGEVRLLIR